MTWLDKAWNWIKSGVSSVVGKTLGTNLTGAEREANVFSSNEALLQREWSSQEAERARDWNEEMYAKYNSLSGKIAQAEESGVNPMFAVTGSAVSPMTTGASAPSGSSASSVSPTGNALTDMIGQIMGIMKLKSEVENIKADTEEKRAKADKTSKEASWVDQLSQAQLDHLVSSKEELQSRLGVNEATATKLEAEFSKLVQETARISRITDAEVRRTRAEAALAEWQENNKALLVGLDAGSDVLSAVTQIATQYMANKTKLIVGR